MTLKIRLLAPFVLLGLVLAMPPTEAPSADAPSPPAQPVAGPGGQQYRYAGVDAIRLGEPPTGAWLFLPRDPIADAESDGLPLVVFLHGFSALDPEVYRAWIDHLVKRGAAVAYPDYQTADPLGTPVGRMLPNAVAGVRAALQAAERDEVGIDAERMALVGHSLGGVLAAGIASTAADEGLPRPAALMPVNPGGCRGCGGPLSDRGAPLPDLAAAPGDMLVAVVVSEDDDVVGESAARVIWRGLTATATGARDYVVVRSDRYGSPDLVADHNAPQTGAIWFAPREDALDWYGTWKQFDLLVACAFDGTSCADALGNTPLQRSMGAWSDGRPVRELLVTDRPPLPRPAS